MPAHEMLYNALQDPQLVFGMSFHAKYQITVGIYLAVSAAICWAHSGFRAVHCAGVVMFGASTALAGFDGDWLLYKDLLSAILFVNIYMTYCIVQRTLRQRWGIKWRVHEIPLTIICLAGSLTFGGVFASMI